MQRSREREAPPARFRGLARFICVVLGLSGFAEAQQLQTVAERSDFQATAPYADVLAFCETLAKESQLVHLASMGRTHENRDIPLLIMADPPIQTAKQATEDPRPVVFAMANIHAGEVCGKEASLMLARDLIRNKSPLLKQLIIVFAPIYNADGNERFSTTNRPGQIGPTMGMGQRPNAMGLDLNRDHMKLESPEARSLAKFMSEWNPIIAMDLHTTDGSFHRYRLTYDSPRHPATDDGLLRYGRDTFLPTISENLKRETGVLTFFYGNFNRDHTDWLSYPAAPRYSTHYFGLRNCLGILSEAYAFATYKQRVLVTHNFVHEILKLAAKEQVAIRQHLKQARANAARAKQIAVRFQAAPLKNIKVPAWKEEVAGRGRQVTGEDQETEYDVSYHGVSKSTLDVVSPFAYVVPADQTDVIANLRGHGVRLKEIADRTEVSVQQYSITDYNRARREFQGHRVVSDVQVSTKSATRVLQPGTVVVLTRQPLARLVVNLLEPQSADGLCTWNFFDDALEAGTYPILRINNETPLPLK